MPSERILFVCTGNICRSPMALALWEHLRAKARTLPVGDSGGIAAPLGRGADPLALEVLARRGISAPSNHQSRRLDAEQLGRASLVLVMEEEQRRLVTRKFPQARGKVYRIGHRTGFDIPDPYGKTVKEFDEAFSLIECGVEEWARVLQRA